MAGEDKFHNDNPPPPPPVTPTQQAPPPLYYPIWEVIQKGNGPVQVSIDTNDNKGFTLKMFMKIDLDDKTNVLTYHKKLIAEAVKEKEELKTKLETFQSSSKGLSKLLNSQMSTRDKSRLGYGNQIHEGVLSYEKEVLESMFDSRSSDVEDSPVNDRFVKVEGMHAVPPPMTGIYMPFKSNFRIDESKFTYGPKQSKTSESDDKTSDTASCESNSSVETPDSVPKPVVNEPTTVSKSKVWSDAPIIDKGYISEELVLFTDLECLVLSPDFKLSDENQVLLRVPRQNNMYSFNLENIVPTGGLASLIAKATVDESNK
ncbi:hypothetical protein Tco_1256658 [Tanacetum coccineum]